MKTAFITGVAGQDGSYLAKLLLDRGYKVYGIMKQRTSKYGLDFLGISGNKNLHLIEGDITDPSSVNNAIFESGPDEIYNLAAQSNVGYSFKAPQLTCSVNFMGYLNVLLGARRYAPNARIYQAGTSEMFGYAANGQEKQKESTPFQPKSPYGISKVAAHWAGVNARYEADQFVANGILFNHESPLREIGFVTRKIVDAAVGQSTGDDEILKLGNIDSRRDWGHASDYVAAMWMMLQHDKPDDFVIATGKEMSIRDFVKCAYNAIGKDITFSGEGLEEVGIVNKKLVMKVDKEFFRPNDLNRLCGDSAKAHAILGWSPEISFSELVNDMIFAEYDRRGLSNIKQRCSVGGEK